MKYIYKLVLASTTLFSIMASNAADTDQITVRKVGSEVTPYHYSGSLRDLPIAEGWHEGDPIKEIPRKNFNATDPQNNDYRMSKDPLAELQKLTSPNANRAFDTPVINIDGQGYTGVNPPDTTGAIGKNYYIQSINGGGGSLFTVYNKLTGAVEVGPISMESLAPSGPCTSGSGDPIVLYDETVERWFLQEFVTGANALCFYISATDDPINGGWNFYQFTGATFPDYPHFGVWSDAYYGTANENPATVYAFDRTNMLAGTTARAAQAITLGDLPGYGFQTATPVDWDGGDSVNAPPLGAPGIIMRHIDEEAHSNFPNNANTDLLEIWEFVVDFDNVANSSFAKIDDIVITDFNSYLLDYSVFASIPQPGSSSRLDPIREVILNRLQYRNFGTHEVILGVLPTNLDPATTGSTVIGSLRWFELRRTTGVGTPWTLFQEGTYHPNNNTTENRLVGSVSMDKAGNIAMAYTKTNTDGSNPLSASIAYTGRLDGEATDVMTQSEVVVKTGSGANTSGRWGDYASMDVDPIDECTFWFTGEYQNGSNWGTSISSFVFEGCDGPGFKLSSMPNTIEVCPLDSSSSTIIEVEAFNGYTETVDLSVTSLPNVLSAPVFSSPSVVAPGTSNLTFDIESGQVTGNYIMTVEGNGIEQPPEMGLITKSTDINILYSAGTTQPPNLTAPFDGATNQSLTTAFTWDAEPNATSYRLLVSDDMAFSNIIIDEIVFTNSYTPSASLPDATVLYWKVASQSSCNDNDLESSVYSFSTTALPGSCAIGFQAVESVAYDFEDGEQGWTHAGIGGADLWALSSANPQSGSQAFHGNEANDGNSILVSPLIDLPTGQAPLTLQFWNAQSMEDNGDNCYDGGLLEISTDGGNTFSQVPGSAMFSDPYDGTLASGNTLGAVEAWCGDPQAYLNSIVDIDTYAGQTVQFRFHKGHDGSVLRDGWDIDDVRVVGCEETIPRYSLEADTPSFEVCAGDTNLSSILTATETLGFDNPITLSNVVTPGFVSGISFNPNPIQMYVSPDNSTLSFNIDAGGTTGDYIFTIQGEAIKELPDMGTIIRTVDFDINYSAGVTSATSLITPVDVATNVSTTTTFSWAADANATSYRLMVADSSDFSNLIIDEIVDGTSYSATELPSSTQLYWKVATGSICNMADVESVVQTFITESLFGDCPFGVETMTPVSYDFESGDQGWTHAGVGGGSDNWSLSGINPHSGSQAYHGSESNNHNSILVSPDIMLPNNLDPLNLTFWNRQSMEDRTGGCFDGGMLEISTDGGANYTQVTSDKMLTDPYDGPMSSGNEMGPVQGWCGDPQEYLNSIVDISDYKGQTVKFRFHKGADGSVNHDGWDIDDIKVKGCVVPDLIYKNGFEGTPP